MVKSSTQLSPHGPPALTSDTDNYEWASQLTSDGVDGRIWSGIHFRTADVAALKMGRRVADYALRHDFKPNRQGRD